MKKIAFIGQPEYFRFCYENDLDDCYTTFELPYNFNMQYAELMYLEKFDADYNIFFRGEYIPNELLDNLRGITICLSSEPFPRFINEKLNFSRDSFLRYIFFRHIRNKHYDYVFHYDQASLPFLLKDGLKLSGALPFPVATSTYKKIPLDQQWDIFFIGRSTKHRERFFSHLKHVYNFLHIAHGIWGPRLVEYISSSKICLNIHAENEVSWEPRMQMLLACGAFVISEKITPNDILRPNIDYIEVSTPQELHAAVEYYLEHHEKRKEISANAMRRIHECLDAKNVINNLINGIESNTVERFKPMRGNSVLNGMHSCVMYFYKLKQLFKRMGSLWGTL